MHDMAASLAGGRQEARHVHLYSVTTATYLVRAWRRADSGHVGVVMLTSFTCQESQCAAGAGNRRLMPVPAVPKRIRSWLYSTKIDNAFTSDGRSGTESKICRDCTDDPAISRSSPSRDGPAHRRI